MRTDDENGTNPGSSLKTLFERYGPAVILVDEWVAYARQLRDGGDGERLCGGDFDTQFTFAQALTEAASAVRNVSLLVSIPASDIEVGGDRGKTALEKLKNVVTRKAAQWQPASPDESFEIVRRRLFDPIPDDKAKVRDGVIRAFTEMYRSQPTEFTLGTSEGEYRRRMELSYPIHPELFDRLFGDWSTLDKVQRTRGVLRLIALAISQLWQRGDQSLLIMPGNLRMDSGAPASATLNSPSKSVPARRRDTTTQPSESCRKTPTTSAPTAPNSSSREDLGPGEGRAGRGGQEATAAARRHPRDHRRPVAPSLGFVEWRPLGVSGQLPSCLG